MDNSCNRKTWFKPLLNAFRYSRPRIKEAYRNVYAFRHGVLLTGVLLPLAFWLDPESFGQALIVMVGSILLLLIVELLKSAMEATVNRILLDDHMLVKRAKFIGSAAMFITVTTILVVWAQVLPS
jgi:diacylglycerol kinase (ATP)